MVVKNLAENLPEKVVKTGILVVKINLYVKQYK
jgi:hypothetical protein